MGLIMADDDAGRDRHPTSAEAENENHRPEENEEVEQARREAEREAQEERQTREITQANARENEATEDDNPDFTENEQRRRNEGP